MKKVTLQLFGILLISMGLAACSGGGQQKNVGNTPQKSKPLEVVPGAASRFDIYQPFALKTDLSSLSENQRKMLPLMIEAAKVMDELFWLQSYGDKDSLLSRIQDPELKRFAQINYGPWDRLKGNMPFIKGVNAKPKGAQFYPADMTKEEFEKADLPGKNSEYTLIRRNEAGALISVPYNEAYRSHLEKAADLIRQAAALAEDEAFANYLNLRAKALLTNEYFESDLAWMDCTEGRLDLIIGPIEHYEDQLFSKKTAYEAYVVVRDLEWGERLAKYAPLMPELQASMPVPDAYKAEKPGTDAHLVAADVVYYAGDCNAGSKTIAVNLPNNETIQQEKGTRRTQIKNAMRAKFDIILEPIADVLIADEQRKHITFDAFFANTMFHEVAHGLGIKNTINGKGLVREALKEQHTALEEGKADILGLYMVTKLFEMGEYNTGELMDNYVTFMASIFRSVRFGASSSHGRANMLRFNYFLEKGAFSRNAQTGKYQIDFEKMTEAMNELTTLILKLQGDGDYEGVVKLMKEKGGISAQLQADLDRLTEEGIPVDIVFEQGSEVLGL